MYLEPAKMLVSYTATLLSFFPAIFTIIEPLLQIKPLFQIKPLLQIEPPGLNFHVIDTVLVLVFIFQYLWIRIWKFQEERRGDEQENATWKHHLESLTKGQRAISKFELCPMHQ